MNKSQVIRQKAEIAINDMLDHCAQIQPDQQVLILAHTDGLYDSDNLVDENTVSWIQSAIEKSRSQSLHPLDRQKS